MTNIKEAALAYEGKTTLNIADLDEVSIDVKMEERKFKEGTPEEFKIMVALIDNKEYRVPWSVLSQLKAMLANPKLTKMTKFGVIKTGEGLNNTKYSVVPMGL
jgi:hypothetical protein